MRAPNHLEIKKTCRDSLEALFAHWKLGPVNHVEFDDQGWVNVTVFVNESWVVRFNARDIQLPKFQREKKSFEVLKGIVPVPELVVFDDSKKLAPYDYMICKKITGKNLEKEWPALSESDRLSLAQQAGKILRKIHSVGTQEFGELSDQGPFPQTKSWADYIRFTLNYHLKEASELQLFSPDELQGFLNFFEQREKVLLKINASQMVHGDFHFGNLLFSENKITGVLDFEWALCGDPLMDICNHLRDMDSNWAGSQAAFNEGYGAHTFSKDDEARMEVYRLLKNIELCVVAKRFLSEAELRSFLATTLGRIKN